MHMDADQVSQRPHATQTRQQFSAGRDANSFARRREGDAKTERTATALTAKKRQEQHLLFTAKAGPCVSAYLREIVVVVCRSPWQSVSSVVKRSCRSSCLRVFAQSSCLSPEAPGCIALGGRAKLLEAVRGGRVLVDFIQPSGAGVGECVCVGDVGLQVQYRRAVNQVNAEHAHDVAFNSQQLQR